jgi:hypothetical protein
MSRRQKREAAPARADGAGDAGGGCGDQAQALQLAQEALVLEEANAETHEFIGDVLMALNRGAARCTASARVS